MSNRNAVIIKKVKKVSAAGHHGGAWKVAYADFVTAMMAFFLLLWLLSMVSDEKRARISEYYQTFSLYSESGSSFMSGADDDIFKSSTAGNEKVLTEMVGDDESAHDIQENLSKAISDKLGELEDQVLVEKTKDGIRIHLTDNEGSTMFQSGSSEMTAKAKEVLRVIGENIKSLKNRVSIEGHTDALPFAGKQYSNWELSTERASSARRELEANGLDPKRLISVAGFSDTDPLIKNDPNDARNRRISIILKFPGKEQKKPLLTKNPDDSGNKVSKELMNIIDKSTINARGNNDKEAIKIIDNTPGENTKHSSSSSASVEKESDIAPLNNNFSPVINKEEWRSKLAIPESMSQKDQISQGTQKDNFSPVFGKEGWNPNIAISESMPEEDRINAVSQKDIVSPAINKNREVSEELMKLIDKSTVTARGNNDREAIDIIIDMPVTNNNQPSSFPPDPAEKDPVDPASQKGDFSPVIDKSGWKPVF